MSPINAERAEGERHRQTILITGGSGFVGSNLVRFFARKASVTTTYLTHALPPGLPCRTLQLDITDEEAVRRALHDLQPDVVIHTAGNKNVRQCESDPEGAFRVNARGSHHVAKACREVGAGMAYLSTDLVFACDEGGYAEVSEPRPSTVYGRTKLEGERLVQAELPLAAVCRSGGIYGDASPLLAWLSGELRAGRRVECFTDVCSTPTYVDNLAEMIDAILLQGLAGIFHTVGRERASRYAWFQAFAEVFGYDPAALHPVSAGADRERLLLMPDASLSSQSTQELLGIPFNSIEEGFGRLRAMGGAQCKYSNPTWSERIIAANASESHKQVGPR